MSKNREMTLEQLLTDAEREGTLPQISAISVPMVVKNLLDGTVRYRVYKRHNSISVLLDGKLKNAVRPEDYEEGAVLSWERIVLDRLKPTYCPGFFCLVAPRETFGDGLQIRKNVRVGQKKLIDGAFCFVEDNTKTSWTKEVYRPGHCYWSHLSTILGNSYVIDDQGCIQLTDPEAVRERLEVLLDGPSK